MYIILLKIYTDLYKNQLCNRLYIDIPILQYYNLFSEVKK